MRIECVVDCADELGEGVIWDPVSQTVWWIDIYGPTIHNLNPVTGEVRDWAAPDYLGCLGLRASGGLIVTTARGFHFFDPNEGSFIPIADPESGVKNTRFNDGKTDRQGRFWSGSMFEAPGQPVEPLGALYRMDPDLSVHKVLDGVGCSNGLAWSPDSRVMYFTDSHTSVVWRIPFDAGTGEVGEREVFLDLSERHAVVDGATVDASGSYWLTVPKHGLVICVDAEGVIENEIELPVDMPTCCEFGGVDLDTLYVTSAKFRRSANELRGQKYPGGLFAITGTGRRGIATTAFLG